MTKITLWFEIWDAGDGSAYVYWHLSEPEWREGQMGTGTAETFVGSDIHNEALEAEDYETEESELEVW